MPGKGSNEPLAFSIEDIKLWLDEDGVRESLIVAAELDFLPEHLIAPLSEAVGQNFKEWARQNDGAVKERILDKGLADISFLRALSMQPAQTVDRAARGSAGWEFPDGSPPRFIDPRNSHFVEYFRDGLKQEAMRAAVLRLNARTADVWRLLTAASLEAWQDGQIEPPAVWVDVRDLANIMGYKKHHKGGFKPEHLEEIARSIADLDSFHITIPLGAKVLTQEDPKTGKRKTGQAEATRTYKVLFKAATDEVRDIFGNKYPLRWQLRPGEWIKGYPKAFAPLYRTIVELPAKPGKFTWAKAIGTELSYQYRQDRNRSPEKVLKVSTLLDRACLMDEASGNKNKGRIRTYFEEALDILAENGICSGWHYRATEIDAVDARHRGWFESWLEVHVIVIAPELIIRSLPKISG